MAYKPKREMYLKYERQREYWHFVLYLEPGVVTSGFNGAQIIEHDGSGSPYAAEWLHTLERCQPDALHVALVGSNDAPKLWHPCVYDDPDSPSAVAGDGCLCLQPYQDPATRLPVAAEHYRTISGNIETWRYRTFTPLDLPDGQRLERLIVDRESRAFWIRASNGVLYLVPEERGAGYEVGYGGGGPTELARFIVKVVKSDGYDLSAGTTYEEHYNELVNSWACSTLADQTREISLEQLKALCSTGRLIP